jgi:hypothetical protein
VTLHPGGRQGIVADEENVGELHVFQIAGAFRQRLDQRLRDGGVAAVVDPVALLMQLTTSAALPSLLR